MNDVDEDLRARLNIVAELVNVGLQEQGARRTEAAEQAYRQALSYDINAIAALNNLGTLLSDHSHWDVAAALFRRLLALKPDQSNYITNLATTLLRKEDYAAAERLCWQAIALNEGDWIAYRNLGLCAYHTGQSLAALEYFNKAAAINPGDKGTEADRSMAMMSLGDLAGGMACFKARWQLVGKRPIFHSPIPLFVGNRDLLGKSIIVHHEQGYGDTLHFSRFIPWLRTKFGAEHIIFAGPHNLLQLMSESGMVDEVVQFNRDDTITATADYHVPMVNVPSLFEDLTYDNIPSRIPYFHRPPDRPRWSKQRIDIGICWVGSGAYRLDAQKSMPVKALLPLIEMPNVCLHSLVIGPRESQIEEAGMAGLIQRDLTDQITTFADTARLMADMDLIITIDSAVAHLAGALGYPTLLLLSYSYCWRWLRDRSDTPWYPTMDLIIQPSPGDWASVIAQVQHVIETQYS